MFTGEGISVGKDRARSRVKTVILISLLALLCIGSVELAVCRMMDPVLFARITAPVKLGMEWVMDNARAASIDLTDRLFPEEEDFVEIPDNQFNTDPAIWTDFSYAEGTNISLEERNELEILIGGTQEVIYYNQVDPEWYDQPYGSDTIGRYGCGPTVMAMAVSSLTDTIINPADMAAWAKEQGHWAKRCGSYLSIVEGTAAGFGLKSVSKPAFSAKNLRQELASGKMAVALVTKGHFTNGGHFILLWGVTLDGGILVADPSSRERSLAVWDAQLILDELSSSRNNGAPLWFLYPPLTKEATD